MTPANRYLPLFLVVDASLMCHDYRNLTDPSNESTCHERNICIRFLANFRIARIYVMRPVANKTNLSTTESKTAGDVLFHRLEPVREVWTPAGIVQPSIESERVFQTALGVLYEGDCTTLLPAVIDESIDTIFADPPFNLAKKYGMKVDDARPDKEYVQWSKQWLNECIRVLKPGGRFLSTTSRSGTSS